MANHWELDDDQLAFLREALDDVVTNWGKSCTAVYPAAWRACSNCLQADSVGGKPLSRWRHGGPIPFPAGSVCPLCDGQGGKKVAEATEELTLVCAFEPKDFFYPIPNLDLRMPHSLVQVKGFLADWPKVQRADRLLVQTPLSGLLKLAYRLEREGLDLHNVVQGRYFAATLKRA